MSLEKQDNNISQTIKVDRLGTNLKAMKGKDYHNSIRAVRKDLYLPKNKLAEIEALLIKATEDQFGNETLKADSVLVSLGLVKGYGHYGHNNFDSKKYPIRERYKKFLRESNYISAESEYTQYSSYEEAANAKEKSKKKDGTIADKEALEIIRSTLGTNVGRWIEQVADYLNEEHKDKRLPKYLDAAVKKYPSTNPDHIPDNELPPLKNPRNDIDVKKGETNPYVFLKTGMQSIDSAALDNIQRNGSINPIIDGVKNKSLDGLGKKEDAIGLPNSLGEGEITVKPLNISEDDKAIVESLNILEDNKNYNKPASAVDDDTSEGINSEEDHPSDNPEDDEASVEPLGGLDADKTTNEPTTDPDDKPSGVHPLCVFIKKHPFLFVIVVLPILALIVFFIYNICGSAQRDTHDISSEPGSITEELEDISEIDDSESPINERISPDWGDSIGGRTSYTAGQLERNILANQVVFNSKGKENDPGECKAIYPGDEKNFVKVWLQNTDSDNNDLWESENITVENGKSYMIRIDINNDNPKEHIVAKDTKVALSIPSYSDTQIPVRGYIESSNAEPSKIWDGVVFSSAEGKSFHLRFRPNTATLYNEFTGTDDGMELSDDIVLKAIEGGTLIGYDDLNGEIPGGSQYSSRIEAWVDVIYDKYSVATRVRKIGATEWCKTIDAEIGDQIEFQIEYNNTGTETQDNVMIRDILPGNLKYVPGTTKLYNMNYPNWATLTPDGDIVTRGVNIGSYLGSPDGKNGGNAFIRFTAEVVDTDLACGENFIYNWGQATVDNDLIENPSVVIVQKPEQ